MPTPSHKWINAQSDIWETGAAPEGEFVLLPVGVPPLITTNQTIVLANDPSTGQEGYSTAGQNWSPKPLSAAYGTLTAGEDFFPFYRDGIFWYTRQIKSMILNGILFDSAIPEHRFTMEIPSIASFGFYRINLGIGPAAPTFAPIKNLTAGQTLTITAITLATS